MSVRASIGMPMSRLCGSFEVPDDFTSCRALAWRVSWLRLGYENYLEVLVIVSIFEF